MCRLAIEINKHVFVLYTYKRSVRQRGLLGERASGREMERDRARDGYGDREKGGKEKNMTFTR